MKIVDRLSILLLTCTGLAQAHPAEATQSVDHLNQLSAVSTTAAFDAATSSETESPSTRLYGAIFAGIFKPTSTDDKFDAEGTGYGWGLSLSYRLTSWLGLDSEFLYFQGDYERIPDSLPQETAGNEIKVASVDVSIRARASYPVWKLSPFVGGGPGYVDIDLYTKCAESELFENSAGGQALGWQAVAGLAFSAVKRVQVEVGWRRIQLRHDFGIYGNGDVNLGGNMLYLAILTR